MGQARILGESVGQYPLTSRQRDPYGMARLPEHVVALTYRIKGELRAECLRDALGDVVERHEALRTRIHYSETDGNLGFQEVLPPLPVPLTVHDIPVVPGRSREEAAIDLFIKLNDEGLPFNATPSLRAALHRFDDDDAVLTLLTHHLFSDEWSASILRREMVACYQARVTGMPHGLPAPVPYREFASWEQEFLQGEKGEAARRFWMDKLAGAELLTMPADRLHDPDTPTPRNAVGNFSIDPADFAKVTATAAQYHCTAWHVLLAALMVLAERVSGRSDITIPIVSSGRLPGGFYNTIGLFADFLPIRLEFGDCKSFLDLMLLVRKASADAHKNQIPMGMILEMFPDLGKAREDPRTLLPGFNYQSSPLARDDAKLASSIEPVFPLAELPGRFNRGAFKWHFRVVPRGEFRCLVEYEPDAVDASTVDRWGSDFIGLILAIASRPGQAWKKL